MKVTNKGIVFINENCIGCNTCIPGCPVPGANIAKIKRDLTVPLTKLISILSQRI